jgi:hypothetical protein
MSTVRSGSPAERLVTGALAGLAGTAAMTVLMNPGLAGALPRRWRPDEFVPKQVVQWAEAVAGRHDALGDSLENAAAALFHLGYGAGMGAIFGLLRHRTRGIPPEAAGAVWGLVVWMAGYEGWLPAAGVRPATTHQPASKWPLQIGNHLVYGMVTALAYDALGRRVRRSRAPRLRI